VEAARFSPVIELGEYRSTTGNLPPSRPPSRLEEELKIVSWSELKPHIDVFEADGKARTGLLVGNNPINWTDPLGFKVTFTSKKQSLIDKANEALKKAGTKCSKLQELIDDPREIVIWIDEGVDWATIGSWAYSTIDWSDVEAVSNVFSPEGIVAHEVTEQWGKQVEGTDYETAHAHALFTETQVTGYNRITNRKTGDETLVSREGKVIGTFQYNYSGKGNVMFVTPK